MKRKLFAALLALAASVGAAAHAQTVKLKVHHFLPATANAHRNVIAPWCAKVAADSGGRLKCQIYPAMQLGGTPGQLFDQARDGVADIVWTVPTYAAGRFTKSEVFELPFMVRSAKGGSQALWSYVQKHALDEFRGTRPLFMHVHDGSALHLARTPVKTLEDLKGLKVRAATRINARMLDALGATPVQMPLPQVPESLSKNVIDGAMVPWEGVPAIKLQEITKYSVDVPAGASHFSNTIFAFVMNQAKYDSLPADLRKVIDANSGLQASAEAGEKGFDAVVAPHRKLARDRGNSIVTLSQDEYQRWVKATAKVDDDWIQDVAKKGGDGRKLLDDARALIKQYEK